MPDRTQAIHFAHQNQTRFLDEMKDLLSIPSVSTDPERIPDMQKAAEWLMVELKKRHCTNIQLMPTPKHPIVFAEFNCGDPSRPTVLVYGHYDVQPADPLELWQSAPFTPDIRKDYIFARGASDMKGQIIACLKAIESIQAVGEFPANLEPFIRSHVELLKCDMALNPDSGMIAADIPTVVYGLRGLAYFEIRLRGQTTDLHSGIWGGVVENPANVLASLIAGMKDADHRVTLPGFYDRVRSLTEKEKAEMSRLPMDEAYYLQSTGARALAGEKGYSWVELASTRPTLDVNGLYSGFTGEGSKTVIPCYAMAKVSMRLVPDQDPEEVRQSLVKYIEAHLPATMTCEVLIHAGNPASFTDLNTPGVKALEAALTTVYGKQPVFKREGGSIPVVLHMKRLLGAESILTGFGLPDDNLHAPNEHLNLPNWFRGIDTLIHFFYNLVK